MERDILEILDTQGPLHVMEIAKQINGHPIAVDQACSQLHTDGEIAPIGRGRYRLTDDGKDRLSDDCKQSKE